MALKRRTGDVPARALSAKQKPRRIFAIFVLIIESLPLAVARVVAVVVVIIVIHLDVVVFQVVIGENVVVVIFGILQGDGGFNCVVDHY